MPKPIIKGYTPDWGSVVGGVRTGQFSVVGSMSDEIISQLLYVSISGTFTGTVYLERFVGSTWAIVDTFNSPEVITFENPKALRMRLRCAVLSSGTVSYAIQDVYVAPTAEKGDPGPPGPISSGSASGNWYATRAAIEAAHIPVVVDVIHTEAFDEPGDGGDWSYTRHPVTPANHWLGRTSTYLSRPNLGYVRSADGQWWRGVTKNTPLKVECWGGRADLWLPTLTDEQWEVGSINPSPTDNVEPFIECFEFASVASGGYTRVGPSIQLGHGHYYFSDTVSPWFRNITLNGMGPVIYDGCTRLVFAAGKAGIHLRSSGEAPVGGRVICTLRGLDIRSLGYGGQTNKHGVDALSNVRMYECRVDGFGGCGIQLRGSVPTSESSYFYIGKCMISNNAMDGIELFGGDANIGVTEGCFFYANKRWGLYDHAFLGNNHKDHHATTNGQDRNSPVTHGGPFKIDSVNGPCTLFGCYSESDQQRSQINGPTTVVGGLHAAGIKLEGLATAKSGADSTGGDYWYTKSTGSLVYFGAGVGGKFYSPRDTVFSFGQGNRGINRSHNFIYNQFEAYGFQHGHEDFERRHMSFAITPEGGSLLRTPWIRVNHSLLPKGLYYGGVGEGADEDKLTGIQILRRMWVTNNPLSVDNTEHRLNDLAIATDGKSLGRLCTTQGVLQPNWATGGFPYYGQTFTSAAGRVYWMDRPPYDPDLWVMPPPIVRATHTSGTVAYDELNQLYDLETGFPYSTPVPGINATEHPTAGAWSWFPVDESLYPSVDFTDRTKIPHWDTDSWSTNFYPGGTPDQGTWMRNPTNGITYSCVARPVQPTKIYDQAWSQPASTIEPTHLSGTQEYREPNPDIDGSEPADIPGYVWVYLHSNITPAYTRVGAVFLEGSATYDAPNIADGASDPSEITITVTGAALGDFVVSVSCDIDTQGLTFIGSRVQAANTVKTRLRNNTGTGAAVNLASATYRARVEKHL